MRKSSICLVKAFFYFILLNAIIACNNPQQIERKYSGTQTHLFAILDNYSADFATSHELAQQEYVRNTYSTNIRHFLVDSMGRYLDSMLVTVDTIIQDGWTLTTLFHTREIEFKYSMTFRDSMNAKSDSLYRVLSALKPGEEIMTNFELLGGAELNSPVEHRAGILRLFAFPVPLGFSNEN